MTEMSSDSQVTEIVGRNFLIHQILLAGHEVAIPVRDRGTDLIVFQERPRQGTQFQCLPMQVKAATTESFAVFKKYKSIPGLVIVYVWNVGKADEDHPTYAMTYADTVSIAEKMGWTRSPTWASKTVYSTTQPSAKLKALLKQHLMTPVRWREIFATFGAGAG